MRPGESQWFLIYDLFRPDKDQTNKCVISSPVSLTVLILERCVSNTVHIQMTRWTNAVCKIRLCLPRLLEVAFRKLNINLCHSEHGADPILVQCCSSVADGCPTLNQHRVIAPCLVGWNYDERGAVPERSNTWPLISRLRLPYLQGLHTSSLHRPRDARLTYHRKDISRHHKPVLV